MSNDEFLLRLERVLDAPAAWRDDEALALLGKHWQAMVELPEDVATQRGTEENR
jgi:hypothetical protein